MLDTSIPLSIKNLDAGSAINTFDNAQNQAMNLRSMAQQQDMRNEQLKASRMQNSEELRKQQEDKSIRGIMQVNDTTTPEGQQQALQDLQTVGLGHRAQEYAAQFSAQSAARQKALDDRAAAKLKFQSDTSDLQKKIEVAHNEFMAKAAGTVLSLPPEQRQDYWSHIKQGALDSHIDAGDMPDQVPQDENLLKHLSRVNLPPDKQAELAQGDQFNSLKPELDRIMTPPKGGWNPTKGEKATALATAISKIPAPLLSSPAGKEWVTAQKGEPQTTVYNPMTMGAMMMAPVPENILSNAAKRIADKKSTLSEEISKGRWTGQKAMEIHDALVSRVSALDPNYGEQESEAGAAYAKSPKVKTSIQQLDNAYSTIDRLKAVYSKLDNGQFPTINKAMNAGKVQMGDVKAAQAAIAEVLGNDELTQAFARGGMGSDKLRGMSDKLANYNLSPQQTAAQFEEVLQGVKRSRQAYETQGAGYIKPMKESKIATPEKTSVTTKSGKTFHIEAE